MRTLVGVKKQIIVTNTEKGMPPWLGNVDVLKKDPGQKYEEQTKDVQYVRDQVVGDQVLVSAQSLRDRRNIT